MTYSILNSPYDDSITGIKLGDSIIPLNLKNRDYQEILDDIIENGDSNWDVDIPESIQTDADTKLFEQQVEAYKTASARLEQYQLSVGVPESSKIIVIGHEWNEETEEMQDITETVVIPAIEPLEATVEVTSTDFDTDTSTTETVPNPLIVKDDEERDAAQVVIDNTPQAVKDHVDGE
jgi:hypothetical protein